MALLVFVLAFLSLGEESACADTAVDLANLPILDSLSREESSLSNGGKWTALGWDTSTSGFDTGRVTSGGWAPADPFPTVNGAAWNLGITNDAPGGAASVTMQASPGTTENYLALWLDIPKPSVKSGYQLRWTFLSGSAYKVTLSKWSTGAQTVLAEKASEELTTGSSLAISDTGGTVTVWKAAPAGAFTPVVSASDTTYSSGYAGLEGSGNASRSVNFKAGGVGPPETTIAEGPSGVVLPGARFSFTGAGSTTGFECFLDIGFSGCASPKAYEGLVEGPHAFKVRAKGASGADPTPAERSLQVVSATKAASKTPLLDSFERTEAPLANGKWLKLSWATEIGAVGPVPFRGYGSAGGIAGAYWNPGTLSDGEESLLVSAVVGTGPTPAGQYTALWLNMPSPGTVRTGYEARFTGVDGSATNYKVELSKWSKGTRTVLASVTGFPLPVGATVVLSETRGGSLALWVGTTTLTQVLTAVDSSYTSGYAGIEVSGAAGSAYKFRAGRIDIQAPETTITSGSSGTVLPAAVSFSFSSSEELSSFECQLDSQPFSACAAPKSYSSINSGPHSFSVRATDAVGNRDESPATRTFQVAKAPAVTTEAATGVQAGQAELHGTVNPENAETTYQYEYGLTTAYGTKIPATAKGIGSGGEAIGTSQTVTALKQGTTYHYRLAATNPSGTSYGTDKTFKTLLLPEAETEGASAVDANEAILEGTVDPNSSATSYEFEYGPTTTYGSIAPAGAEEVGAGSEPAEVEEAVAYLDPESTYHYRVVAQSPAGTVVGEDHTLTTAAATVSPQREEEELREERNFTGALGSGVAADFMGLNWSGDNSHTAEPARMEAVRRSGAQWLRVGIGRNCEGVIDWATYDRIFERAANRGITILPIVGGGPVPPAGSSKRNQFIQDAAAFVDRYGPGGTLWATMEQAKRRPAAYWEFWNEPNYAVSEASGTINPAELGDLLHETAPGMRSAARGEIHIILGGLLSYFPQQENQGPRLAPNVYIAEIGAHGRADYDAVGLHPYVFTAGGGAPTDKNGVEGVREKIRGHVKTFRDALDTHGSGNKSIWITELGWPVPDGSGSAESKELNVSPGVQRELIEATVSTLKQKAADWSIQKFFYYNTQDENNIPCLGNVNSWDYRSGLRTVEGKYREGWWGYQRMTGAPKWPVKAKATTSTPKPASNRAQLMGTVNPYGSPTSYQFKWGPTSSYGHTTAWKSAGFEEGDVTANAEITGLTKGQSYHYRIVALNDNEEVSEGADLQFTAAPNTTTYISEPVETLNGNPGWVTVKGGVAGEQLVDNSYVNLNFSKWENGAWKPVTPETSRHPVIHNGVWEEWYWGVGKGTWRVKAVFPGYGSFDESESGWHEFTIKDGYQLVNVNSGKCLDVKDRSIADGASFQQFDCLDPSQYRNQVFTLVPQGGYYYQLVARHSGRCADVTGLSQSNGAWVQQWDCGGSGQTNQIWKGEGLAGGTEFIAKHSGQCADVFNSGTQNGATVVQWSCTGGRNQLWTFRSVESSPVPSETFLTVSEVLNGEPGMVNVSGNVKYAGYSNSGKQVEVIFERETSAGVWQKVSGETLHLDIDSQGHYEKDYWGVGGGSWRAQAIYGGEASLIASSSSGYHPFTIRMGYRLVNLVSGKCLSISEGSGANGAKALQWDCSSNPQPGDGQVFTWYPMVAHWPYHQIRFNEPGGSNAGKCLDVPAMSTADGVQLQLWECLGEGQDNQLWTGGGPGEYLEFRAKHSGKCMDDMLSGTANGNKIIQYGCNGTNAQKWKFQSVG